MQSSNNNSIAREVSSKMAKCALLLLVNLNNWAETENSQRWFQTLDGLSTVWMVLVILMVIIFCVVLRCHLN